MPYTLSLRPRPVFPNAPLQFHVSPPPRWSHPGEGEGLDLASVKPLRNFYLRIYCYLAEMRLMPRYKTCFSNYCRKEPMTNVPTHSSPSSFEPPVTIFGSLHGQPDIAYHLTSVENANSIIANGFKGSPNLNDIVYFGETPDVCFSHRHQPNMYGHLTILACKLIGGVANGVSVPGEPDGIRRVMVKDAYQGNIQILARCDLNMTEFRKVWS